MGILKVKSTARKGERNQEITSRTVENTEIVYVSHIGPSPLT
jgi:hypothetical protein